jgi:hypothetical protein
MPRLDWDRTNRQKRLANNPPPPQPLEPSQQSPDGPFHFPRSETDEEVARDHGFRGDWESLSDHDHQALLGALNLLDVTMTDSRIGRYRAEHLTTKLRMNYDGAAQSLRELPDRDQSQRLLGFLAVAYRSLLDAANGND